MTNTIILLFVGFVILVKGADIFIESACKVAYIFRIPMVIIGIVIIGFGTSLPEFSVTFNAVLKHHDTMAVSTIIGSNLFNLLFIIGSVACFTTITVKRKLLTFELPYLVISAFILMFAGIDNEFFGLSPTLTRLEGVILLITFCIFLTHMWFVSKKRRSDPDEAHNQIEFASPQELKVGSNLLSVIVGVILVIYGGDLVVEKSVAIAQHLGVSAHLVGVTIVGIGTSLPEYVVSIMAAIRHQQDLIVGNIIGSNIFNGLFILGSSALLHSIGIPTVVMYNSIFYLFCAVLFMVCIYRSHKISRLLGGLFALLYIGFLYFTF
jgi:cation:H+ antiporter